jgi:APA family basic amino acid/polyamine antiporter
MTELKRVLGFRDLTLLTIGAVIGSGIFIVPAFVLKQTSGSLTMSTLVWLIAGVLSLLGALTYGELSAMQPEAGGLYVYIRDGFGKLVAFLYGWTLFFVIGSGAVATLSVAFATYLRELVDYSDQIARLISIGMIVAVTVINVKGTRDSANVQNWTTVFKAAALLVMALLLLFTGSHLADAPATAAATRDARFYSALLTAMIGVLWAYEGWQFVTFSAGETINPQRTFPRGIVAGTAILIVLYCLASIGYVSALGPDGAANSERIAADAVSAQFGSVAAKLIVLPIIVAMFSAANAITLTSPRVFYAMARDRVFFQRLADVHPRFGTPAVAVIAMNAVSIVLAVTGTFEQLLTYVVFTGWIFYALGAASIFVYRRRRPELPRPFKVPLYPLTPFLFVVAAGLIVANTLYAQPARALIGLGIVLIGTPVYFIWRRVVS